MARAITGQGRPGTNNRFQGRSNFNSGYNPQGGRNWNNNRAPRDPNAMDTSAGVMSINAMTPDERFDLMRKGACFNCKQTGHMARDCPKKNRGPPTYNRNATNTGNYRNYSNNQNAPKKWTPKEINTHIKAMSNAERDELAILGMMQDYGPNNDQNAKISEVIEEDF